MNHTPPPPGEIILYETEDGLTRLQVRLANEVIWLTQRALAELYQTSVPNINMHISNIYEEGELLPEATIKQYLIVQTEGQRQISRQVEHYSLPMIIAIGYRVRSTRGTQFRRWATERLNEYLVKGFTMDDERLKEGQNLGADYFDELLERIRDIRASERRFYQKITDIYAQCSTDYDAKAPATREFFATVQNKLHWAIHGHTAAELIAESADAEEINMGLKTWKNAPGGKIRKSDVGVAKNYLDAEHLRGLNRIVTMYLDYAETQAERRRAMTMTDWTERLDAFLKFNEKEVLGNAGKVSAEVARRLAEEQFEQYHQKRLRQEAQAPSSDFDRAVEKFTKDRKTK